jgi:iron complex outermembrane receptor protein
VADSKLSVAAAAFYNDVRDYQDLRPTAFGGFLMLNAARAHTVGVELELAARPNEHWEFTFAGGWVDARFDRFTDTSNGVNLDGNTINFVPEYTLDAAVTWRPIGGWFARLDTQGIGPFWFDEGNTQEQSTYWLLNARVGWQGKNFACALFGQNLLDTEYVANAIHRMLPGAGDFFSATPGDPLVLGVEVSARF